MPQIPREVERMGPALQGEVERQLVVDLAEYGVAAADVRIDWSNACQEGHCTKYLGGVLEDLSGIVVRSPDGAVVAEGWMDFVHGGDANPLFVFWLFLSIGSENAMRKVKADNSIPSHVWQRLPVETKSLCTREGNYDSRWARDPRVNEWRNSHAR